MSIELEGMSDEWEVILDSGEDFEKAKTTWNGREILLLPARGQEDEIFKREQIEFALIQERLQKDGIVHDLCSHVEYPLPFEEFFFDLEEEIMLEPAWGIDPNQQFMLAPPWIIDPNQQFMLAPPNMQSQIVRCGLKKFWKKHKKAIIITAVVVVVVVGTVIAVTVLSASAASTVAGVGGSAIAGLAGSDSSATSPPPSSTNTPPPSSGSSSTYLPPSPPSFGSFDPPKDFTSSGFTPTPPLPPLDLHSMLPSSQSPLPGFQSYSPPPSFHEPKIPSSLQPPSLPSYSPALPSDHQNNFTSNLPPPPPPPDMTKFWELKAPVPFAPLSGSICPSILFPCPANCSKLLSNLRDLFKCHER